MVKTLQTGKPIDFSIMPSFKCNLNCWFCMYDCSPTDTRELDYGKTKAFLAKFDWGMINAFGFYGGEPSIAMSLYDKFIDLVPKSVEHRFVITNGAWSQDTDWTIKFLNWCGKHHFHIMVSSTPEHINHQKRFFLEAIAEDSNGGLELKKPDKIHAQGRARNLPNVNNDCMKACLKTDRNIRLGLKPDGNVVFQNCHGEYHIVQTYADPFEGILERTQEIVSKCLEIKLHNG